MEILLVFNNKIFSEYLASVLKDKNHLVTIAYDGIEAINNIDSKKFDLLITGIVGKFFSGLEIIKYFKDKYPQSDIIAITHLNNLKIRRNAFELGVKQLYIFPIEVSAIVQNIKAS